MRVSQFPISTLKEAPSEAEVVSHKLMLRTGLIKRLTSGVYSWMPVGLRVLRKVEKVVREEMNRSGAIELMMPVVQPAELWQESGRWEQYGAELVPFFLESVYDQPQLIQPDRIHPTAEGIEALVGATLDEVVEALPEE